MATTSKNSPLIQVGCWLISLLCFAIGFWHTHLGLREFKVLGSEYGGLLVAGIVLLVMLIGYSIAINGKTWAIIFYIIGGLTFFVFNLNSFYPNYLGRTLVKEEAKALNDSLSIYQSRVDKLAGNSIPPFYQKIQALRAIMGNILREIEVRGGFGDNATQQLREFNRIAGTVFTPERKIDETQKDKLLNDYKNLLANAIKEYILKSLSGKDQEVLKLIEAKEKMDVIVKNYGTKLEDIIKNNETLYIEAIKTDPQITTLQEVVTKLDEVAIDVNSVIQSDAKPFVLFNQDSQAIQPKNQHLGTFSHTISSVKERIGKIDTMGIIFICLLIDLLAPLAVYFFLRKKEGSVTPAETSFNPFDKGQKPSTF